MAGLLAFAHCVKEEFQTTTHQQATHQTLYSVVIYSVQYPRGKNCACSSEEQRSGQPVNEGCQDGDNVDVQRQMLAHQNQSRPLTSSSTARDGTASEKA